VLQVTGGGDEVFISPGGVICRLHECDVTGQVNVTGQVKDMKQVR
jgi:hypothetical protein